MSTHSLVVGGTRGVGREVVRLFSERGHTVSVIGKRPPGEQDRGIKGVAFWSADLLDQVQLSSALKEVVQKNGKLNYLVFLQRFKGEGDKWAGELETSLSATQRAIESLTGEFADFGDKGIVVVSSIADEFVSEGQPVGYHVAKAGLFKMACYYAVTLGAKGIRSNCVSPCTFVKEENRDFYDKNEALVSVFRRTIPLGRMGTAKDVAHVIAFLCSPEASFVTGQRVTVDGGVSLVSQEALARKIAGV